MRETARESSTWLPQSPPGDSLTVRVRGRFFFLFERKFLNFFCVCVFLKDREHQSTDNYLVLGIYGC